MKWLCAFVPFLFLAACGGGGSAGGDAAGILDASFNAARIASVQGTINDVLELPDGSLLLAGSTGFVAKLNADGALDPAFATGGIDWTERGTAATRSTVRLAPYPQGAITVLEIHASPCIGGFCNASIGDVVARRMSADGVDDATYGVSGLGTLPAARGSIVVSPDGRVTAFAITPGRYRSFFQVQALDAMGRVDMLFARRAEDAVRSCRGSVLPYDDTEPRSVVATGAGDGILIAASWPNSGLCLVRLDAQGALDSAFAFGGRRGVRFDRLPDPQLPVLAVFARGDGQIAVVMALTVRAPAGSTRVPAVLFFASNGDLASVTSRPDGFPAFMIDVAMQANGKLVSAGFATADGTTPQLWRSMPEANASDGSFGPFGLGYNAIDSGSLMVMPEKVIVDRAGRILVSGSNGATREPAVIRFR